MPKGFDIEMFEYGKGDQLLITFHGYGRNASEFKALASHLGNKYTIVAVNLPFHGHSKPLEAGRDVLLDRSYLKELISGILNKHQVKSFSLLGFSLGGRVALCCLEELPEQVDKMWLFAPDGLQMSAWYRFSTGTFLGRSIIKGLVNNPAPYYYTLGMVKKLVAMNERKYRFLYAAMEDRERRTRVYNVWMALRGLLPDTKRICRIVNRRKMLFRVFLGDHDSIIPSRFGQKLNCLSDKDTVKIIPSGHHMDIYMMGRMIAASL